MNKNIRRVFFLTTLLVLLVGISALSAADVSDNTTTTQSIAQDTPTTSTQVAGTVSDTASKAVEDTQIAAASKAKSVDKNTQTSTKTTKTVKTSTNSVNNNTFDSYFTSKGFTNKVSSGDTINFGSDIGRYNKTTYIVNKQVHIDGNGHTLTLNTTSGSYYGNETGASFIIDNGAAGSTLTNIRFYNTQVIIRNTTNVTVNNCSFIVDNQRIGQGIGATSIRAGSSYITVENSTFQTTNNSGSSSLVLASASYCKINNNNITGTGTVGNLLYLTTYNIEGVDITDIELNSYNNITNNRITGPSSDSVICYGIALTGHDNLIENNIINYSGQAITTQWAYIDPATPEIGNNSDRYKGNYYYNNTILNGGSFKATNNSTLTNNKANGTVVSGENSTLTGNTFKGNVILQSGANASANNISVLTTNGNNVLYHNLFNGAVTTNGVVILDYNTFNDIVTIKNNATMTRNGCNGNVTVYGNDTIDDNAFNMLNITGSNVKLSNNVVEELYTASGLTNITSYNDIFMNPYNESEIIYLDSQNSNLKSLKSETITENGIEWTVYHITNETYTTYVNKNTGRSFQSRYILNNPHIIFYVEYFPTKEFLISSYGNKRFNGYEIKVIGVNNLTLTNTKFLGQAHPELCNVTVTLANMTLNYNDTPAMLNITANNMHLENLTINSNFVSQGNDNIETINLGYNSTINNCNVTINVGENLASIQAIRIGSNSTVENSNIFLNNSDLADGDIHAVDIGSDSIIKNTNITMNAVGLVDTANNTISSVYTTGNNVTISDCNILANIPSNYINWNVVTHPAGMAIYATGNNTIINNNNITVNDTTQLDTDRNYNTLYGMLIGSNSTITNNNINITGTEYLYGIQIRGSNNNVSNNNISEKAINYLSGIMLEGQDIENNTIAYNNIVFTGGNRSADPKTLAEDSVYGISAQDFGYKGYNYTIGSGNVVNNKILYNNITGTGYNVYAFEQFGGDNTTVTGNNINITAHTPMGVGIIGSYCNVTDNNITVSGADNGTYTSADYLKPRTTGVYFAYGINNTATNNNINCSNNAGIIISSEKGSIAVNNIVKSLNNTYAVSVIDSSSNITVTNNTLNARELKGDEAVLDNGANSIVKDNNATIGPKLNTTVTIDPINGVLGKEVSFTAHVVDENNKTVTDGYVIFKVNGVTLKDSNNTPIQVNVTNGTAVLTTTATWSKAVNTTAAYSGSDNYNKARIDNGSITIAKQNATVNVTINENIKPGDNLTATVNVTDAEGNIVNAGTVIFKINGKTLKDENNQTIVYNVTNGTVTLNYHIPENYSAKTYTLTAVYGGSIYNRAETTQNFTLSKLDANVALNVTTDDLKPGSQVIAIATVTDANGNPVTRGYVTFKLNNKALRNADDTKIRVNVTNGTAVLNYTIPGNYSTKTYLLGAEFGGSNYNNVEAAQNITLSKIDTTLQQVNVSITDNTLHVQATINNAQTGNVANERVQKVSVKYDKHTVIKEVNVTDGVIDLNTALDNVTAGEHTVEIVTSGNGIYNQIRQNITVTNEN